MSRLLLIAMALLAVSCHKITEFESSGDGAVTCISIPDLEIQNALSGIGQGRCLVPLGSGGIAAVSGEGLLYRISGDCSSVDTVYSIGGSSGSGYSDAVLAYNGNIYCTGPGSTVIEVDPSTNTLLDTFKPGQKPERLAASFAEGRVYFTDIHSQCVSEIRTLDNSTGFESGVYYPPADVFVHSGGRHIIIPCSDDAGSIYGIWLNLSPTARPLLYNANFLTMGSPCSCSIPLERDSAYAVACPDWSSDQGYVRLVYGYVVPTVVTPRVYVEGHPVGLCFSRLLGQDGLLFVLCRTESGNTAVSILGFDSGDPTPKVQNVIHLTGKPMDMELQSDSRLVVLTSG